MKVEIDYPDYIIDGLKYPNLLIDDTLINESWIHENRDKFTYCMDYGIFKRGNTNGFHLTETGKQLLNLVKLKMHVVYVEPKIEVKQLQGELRLAFDYGFTEKCENLITLSLESDYLDIAKGVIYNMVTNNKKILFLLNQDGSIFLQHETKGRCILIQSVEQDEIPVLKMSKNTLRYWMQKEPTYFILASFDSMQTPSHIAYSISQQNENIDTVIVMNNKEGVIIKLTEPNKVEILDIIPKEGKLMEYIIIAKPI